MKSPRAQSESDIYHIVARGTGKQLIFEDDADHLEYLSLMSASLTKEGVELYAWCLMGNHIHLLLHAPIERISNCMKNLLGSYARYFNERHGRVGHLFQERFRSVPVDSDEQLIETLLYIHLNPCKAYLGSYPSYAWSSYCEYLDTPRYCTTDFIMSLFDGIDDYVASHKNALTAYLEQEEQELIQPRHVIPDIMVVQAAEEALFPVAPSSVKSFSRDHRDELLRKLKTIGLSLRQIERVTGISKSVVARA